MNGRCSPLPTENIPALQQLHNQCRPELAPHFRSLNSPGFKSSWFGIRPPGSQPDELEPGSNTYDVRLTQTAVKPRLRGATGVLHIMNADSVCNVA